MDEKTKQIQDLIDLCRKNGVLKIKTAEIELELAPESPEDFGTELAKTLGESVPDDMDMLFGSVAPLSPKEREFMDELAGKKPKN